MIAAWIGIIIPRSKNISLLKQGGRHACKVGNIAIAGSIYNRADRIGSSTGFVFNIKLGDAIVFSEYINNITSVKDIYIIF